MDRTLIILIVMALFMFMLITGHKISSVLFTAGILGIIILSKGSLAQVKGIVVNEPYQQIASYTMSTVPLYIIMAEFIIRSNIIRDFYALIFKLSKGRKAALGTMTILLGGFLGAVSGSGMATSAAMGKVGVPELRARGYSQDLAGTVAAAAGTLSAVIPPSMTLIVYGVAAEVSVAKLFIATLIPGILAMVTYAVVAIVILNTKSEKLRAQAELEAGLVKPAEDLDLSPGRTIFVVVVGAALVLIIFVGIYTGKFSPTEAGAVGAFLGFLVTIITRTLSLDLIISSITSTVKTTGMVLFVMLSATFFGRFVTLSLMPRAIMNALGGMMDHPSMVLALLVLVYFVVFMFVDGAAGLLMTVPVLLPIMQAMNIDLLWFGVFVCMLITLGALTLPVGMCVYSVSAVSGSPMNKMFPLSSIFAAVTGLVVCGLMILFPGLATWLPSLM